MFAKPLNIVQYNMFTSVVCYINYKTDFLFNDVSSLLFKVSWDKHREIKKLLRNTWLFIFNDSYLCCASCLITVAPSADSASDA